MFEQGITAQLSAEAVTSETPQAPPPVSTACRNVGGVEQKEDNRAKEWIGPCCCIDVVWIKCPSPACCEGMPIRHQNALCRREARARPYCGLRERPHEGPIRAVPNTIGNYRRG